MSESIWSTYKQWRKEWDQGTDECFKEYCERVDRASSYEELREIVGAGLTDNDLSTDALKLVIFRGRQVKTLNGW